ncbi:hypothetical protein A3D78_01925 [Candidatus Gottesmanbacteria bacterium RIFCSPHIGHO2_02_FULL_39_14]|uniref:YbaK/aminoacyl-tRNA synthetase-associated domain-containing protein n=3 Tax=Candidatus Gottesmaniibacteriota TaxID=1752720 RepID=A0A1F6A1L7_9BACT|nr:MAG: hypothetical protein A2153_03150 [Candidatus Gottesmanbacteria bacterium RBG_16_38_7b]OGG18553.1 MAG: hypothetical protein A3D78_01925 [Candidatus Gottesmanbacteria bacterium RIFCSPHIGHO2_02_FULL_39_14]OGG31549.1 MAG: hypothetical protein A3I51_04715 [Candidatus Gottesmanbacteria bacterium RIFCSPLOWO2_02_FULL_38_8]
MAETTYQKLKQFYIDNQVTFREIEHAPGASAEEYHKALGCKYEQQLKCLLIKVYEQGKEYFAMVTIPAQKRADFEKLKQIFKAKRIRGATLDELRHITGCEYGEVPAAGKIFNIPLLLDNDFLNEQEVYMNAGIVTKSFVVNPQDLKRTEEPLMF